MSEDVCQGEREGLEVTKLTCLTCGSDQVKRAFSKRRNLSHTQMHTVSCRNCHALEESPHGRDWRAFAPSHSRTAQDARAGAGADAASNTASFAHHSAIGSWGAGKGAGKGLKYTIFYTTNKPSKPPSIPSAGVTVGELTGWRFWLIKDGRLQSIVSDVFWQPQEPMSGDVDKIVMTDWIWGRDIYGGVFAWKTQEQAEKHMIEVINYYRLSDVLVIAVLGSIDLWGNVVEHECGYRAEFARPTSFDRIYTNSENETDRNFMLEPLRQIWGLTQ